MSTTAEIIVMWVVVVVVVVSVGRVRSLGPKDRILITEFRSVAPRGGSVTKSSGKLSPLWFICYGKVA